MGRWESTATATLYCCEVRGGRLLLWSRYWFELDQEPHRPLFLNYHLQRGSINRSTPLHPAIYDESASPPLLVIELPRRFPRIEHVAIPDLMVATMYLQNRVYRILRHRHLLTGSSSRVAPQDDHSPPSSGLGSLPADTKFFQTRRARRGSTNVNIPNPVVRKDTDCSSDSSMAGLDPASFIELIPDPSCVIDANGNVLYSNLKFRQCIRVQIQHSNRFSILSAVFSHDRDGICEILSAIATKPALEFVQKTCQTYTKDAHYNVTEETCEWIFSYSSRLNFIHVSVRIGDRTLPRRTSSIPDRIVRSTSENLELSALHVRSGSNFNFS